ncbi:MAG: RNA polymerase sigma-70 factor, partial [Thermoleophilia bacterium]|nr:RNA polymerase sigma-70 factor [Thermoleophilia bacterium]
YRMLGSLADADDVLQEAYLRWTRADRSAVESPRAYLASTVTRLCLDRRQAIDRRKETYIGPWLPEPLVEPAEFGGDPAGRAEAEESVSLAFLVVLESLAPAERAAYLLRRAFDYDYAEIAAILGKCEPACRQLVSRAESRVRERRPRFEADPAEAERLTGAFLHACATGDLDGLVGLLAADAVSVSDGGGRAKAALAPILGADRVSRFFLGLMRKAPAGLELRRVRVNGRPGAMAVHDGQVVTVLNFDVIDGRIAACYLIRNPDKLARVRAT